MNINNDAVHKYPEGKEIIAEEYLTEHDLKVLNDCWHISIHPRIDSALFSNDPRMQIDDLETVGEIRSLKVIKDEIPAFEKISPDSFYMGIEIDLKSEKRKKDIENKLNSLRNDYRIRILSPNSNISDYIDLIEDLSDTNMRIGEILVEIGSLTEPELNEALGMQKDLADDEALNIDSIPLGELLVEEKMIHESVLNAALKKQGTIRNRKVD